MSLTGADFGLRRTYDDEHEGEVIRTGFEPNDIQVDGPSNFGIGDDEDGRSSGADRTSGRDPSAYDEMNDSHVWSNRSGT